MTGSVRSGSTAKARHPVHRRPPPGKSRPKSAARATQHPYTMRLPQTLWLVPLALLIGFGMIVVSFAREEMQTSKVQARYFTERAREVRFEKHPGPDPAFYVPHTGPYNQRIGYSYLPFFIKVLEGEGYHVAEQMRASRGYYNVLKDGLYPPYHPKTVAGLDITDAKAQALYHAAYPSRVFRMFADVPPLLVATLLHIENRELLAPAPAMHNPVVEWDRLLYASFGHVIQKAIPGFYVGGGSTLATQIEKFRFSPGGQTTDAREKLRQILSASLRVYQDGPDTQAARSTIVLDYLNSTPLSARSGFGEVNSVGDGLWAWFGRDLGEATTALNLPETDAESLRLKATVYRETLALILAQRRPSAYLVGERDALEHLVNRTLDELEKAGVISPVLRAATRDARLVFLAEAPSSPPLSFLDQKAVTALRTHLLGLLGVRNLYELDRLDLHIASTLDRETQRRVTAFLRHMGERSFLEKIGLYGFRLLSPDNDPAPIKWSVLLYEKTPEGNKLRVQADNIDGPLDMNEGVKLDLGSTAKLRTLITYLEIIGELHQRYASLTPDDLRDVSADAPDPLTAWATTWLSQNPEAPREAMLEAAMERHYSASPAEAFFTGGGLHTFVNFEPEENGWSADLYKAFRHSVNLVFVRLMRDIVNYTIAQGPQTKQEILGDPDNPAREVYLKRFAEREGLVYLNHYLADYAPFTPKVALDRMARRSHRGATAKTVMFRSVAPRASFAHYVAWMQAQGFADLDQDRLTRLYRTYTLERFNLADRAYLSGVNPLELWLVSYRMANPEATPAVIRAVSRPVRLESYAWLFRASKRGAQDTRIRILLEQDAFARIQQRWARLGYPFRRLVPSLATAIGSSADRPGALAELAGILVNEGERRPLLRFEKLHFAAGTPYETLLTPDEGRRGGQVLDPAITRIARKAMEEVVADGTARRLFGAYKDATGEPLAVGGKTGTGDHRYDEFGPGGRLISSRVVNRTGTLVFFIGDTFFGTVTAHVAGEQAALYRFTSALSAQMLKALEPVLSPLINGTPASAEALKNLGVEDKPPDSSSGSSPEPPPNEALSVVHLRKTSGPPLVRWGSRG